VESVGEFVLYHKQKICQCEVYDGSAGLVHVGVMCARCDRVDESCQVLIDFFALCRNSVIGFLALTPKMRFFRESDSPSLLSLKVKTSTSHSLGRYVDSGARSPLCAHI